MITPAPETRLAHPVLDSRALSGQPVAVRLLDEDWVVWRDAQGQARAAPDRCPHRGTRLSLGRVVDGEVECPYHGWRFDAGGRCTHVPSQNGPVPAAAKGLCMASAVEAFGLVWLQPAGGEPVLPRFGGEDDPALRKLTVGPYDVATSAPRIVENFLDLAHFGFVHEGGLGDRDHTQVPDYRIVPTVPGFIVQGCRAWQPLSNRLSQAGSWVDYAYEVSSPYSAVLMKLPQAQTGYRDEIALFVCPLGDDASRVWFRLAVTDLQATDAELTAFQHAIFTQDQPVLESQRPRRLPLSGECHVPSDRSATAYRRYLRRLGVRCGVTV